MRDKLCELERCGVAQAVVMRFDAAFAAQSPEAFVANVLVAGLGARYVLVGDDFRFGARRAGDYAMLDAAGARHGFDVARMMSYEVHGLRVSSSAVRAALAAGDMRTAAALLGRPYSISGRVVARRTARPRRSAKARPAAATAFAPSTSASDIRSRPRPASSSSACTASTRSRSTASPASAGGRPSTTAAASCSRRTASSGPPSSASRGATVNSSRVELLHKLRDEARYDSLAALAAAIAGDADDARAFLAAAARTARRDRPADDARSNLIARPASQPRCDTVAIDRPPIIARPDSAAAACTPAAARKTAAMADAPRLADSTSARPPPRPHRSTIARP